VLYVLAYMLKGCDKDGLDLYFTVGLSKHNSKVASGLSQHIRGKALRSTSDAGSRLTTILHDYETKLRRHESKRFPDIFGKSRRVKPLNVYVLTDAVWQPQCDVAEPIRAMVETLRELRYPRKQVGIQFVQFGNDPKCAAKLARLDSGLNLAMYALPHMHLQVPKYVPFLMSSQGHCRCGTRRWRCLEDAPGRSE
jgi:hypothetical protein